MFLLIFYIVLFFFFKQKTAYEMRISDWSSDVCSSDLQHVIDRRARKAPDAILNDPQILGHEPALGQQPVFHVIGRIHLHQRPNQMAVAPRRRGARQRLAFAVGQRSEEHTSELQSLMRISYAVFCLKKKTNAHKENR